MKPSEALNANREAIRRIVESNRASNARIFGSVLHEKDHEGSDIDILVDSTDETSLMDIVKIQDQLERLLGVSVDVMTPLDLPESFRSQVVSEAVVI